MAKFDYKKWITENKHGKLNEQVGSALVALRACGGSLTQTGCLPNASNYSLGHQFKFQTYQGPRAGFLQSIINPSCPSGFDDLNIIEDPYVGACANNNITPNVSTPTTDSDTTTTTTGSATGSGAVTGSVTGSSPTITTTCYACAYEASDMADGAPYTPAATIEIEFSAASINSNGGCAPSGMGNAYMFTELSAQLAANGITPAPLPNQGAGVGDYNMLASYHGIPLNGHWSALVGQTGCPGIGPNAPTGSASPATGDFTDYGIGGGIQFDYPSNWSVTGWTDDFVNMMLAHPNPCNFLNQRYTQFGEALQQGNMGPLQTNLTYQKFAVVHTLLELTQCGLPNPNPFTSLLQEQINEIKLDPKAAAIIKKAAPKFKGLASKGKKVKGKKVKKESKKISALKRIIKETLSELQEQDFMANIKPSFNPMNPGSGGQVSYNCAKNNTCQPVQGLGGDFHSLEECEVSGCGPNPEDFGGGVGHPSGLGHSKRKFPSSNRFRNRKDGLQEKQKACSCRNGVCKTAGGNLCPSHECGGACKGSESGRDRKDELYNIGPDKDYCVVDGDGIEGPLPNCPSGCPCGAGCVCMDGKTRYPKGIVGAKDGSMGKLKRVQGKIVYYRSKRSM